MIGGENGFEDFIKLVEKKWKCDVCNDYQTTEVIDEEGNNQIVCLKCNGLKISGIYDKDGHPDYLNIDEEGKFLYLLCVKFITREHVTGDESEQEEIDEVAKYSFLGTQPKSSRRTGE